MKRTREIRNGRQVITIEEYWSAGLGEWVTVPERTCPETEDYVSECTCVHHQAQVK